MSAKWQWIDGSQLMRAGLLDLVRDNEIACSPGGSAMSLGALCREMGEIEHLQPVKSFRTDFSYRCPDRGNGYAMPVEMQLESIFKHS